MAEAALDHIPDDEPDQSAIEAVDTALVGQDDADTGDQEAKPPTLDEQAAQVQAEIEAMDEEAWKKIESALAGFVGELERTAQEQVTKKILIEQRWIEDLRQYHGRYSAETEKRLKESKKSQVFANLTRPKTHAWAARLGDMLFPTDERNWGIQPTPVPELVDKMQQCGHMARSLTKQANHHLKMARHKIGLIQDNAAQDVPSQPPAPDGSQVQPSQTPPLPPADGSASQPAAAVPGLMPTPGSPPGPPDHPMVGQIGDHISQADSLQQEASQHAQWAAEARATMQEAKDKSDAMEEEIDQQFNTAKWNIKNRTAILDLCKLGTCCLKGPTSLAQTRGSWTQEGNAYKLNFVEDPKPEYDVVDMWNWFPDMDARNPREKEFDFERHLETKRSLRALAKRPGFNKAAIRRILATDMPESPPTYLALLREVTGNSNISLDRRYVIWEYHGAIEAKELNALAMAMLSPEKAAAFIASARLQAGKDSDEDDVLREHQVVIWFGHNEIIKFGPASLDSGESIYSSTSFIENDTSLFGFGVPYVMRNSQAVVNGSWRMMMDNGGISAGPQVVVNENVISPADGVMELTGFKLWTWLQGKTLPPSSVPPFQVFNIANNQEQLINLIKLALEFIDIEISLPMAAQGEQGTHPETAGGRSMLMNSANVIFRWVVKNWDDNITAPTVTRAYDWNMQHSKIDYIKGDYQIDARGSSVLMVRDMQAQNLAGMIANYASNPAIGQYMKVVQAFRKLVQCYGISPDDIVKTDDEIQTEEEQKANQPPSDPHLLEIASREKIAAEANETRRLALTTQRDTFLSGIAAKQNMTLDQLKAKLDMHDSSLAQEERLYAAELARDFRLDANDRQATADKERMIAARTGKPRVMPKNVHQAATDGAAPSGEVSGAPM